MKNEQIKVGKKKLNLCKWIIIAFQIINFFYFVHLHELKKFSRSLSVTRLSSAPR
jgi:hypothetical protein